MLRSIGKESRESVESVLKQKKGCGEKDLQKGRFQHEMKDHDESGESMEPMEEVPLDKVRDIIVM